MRYNTKNSARSRQQMKYRGLAEAHSNQAKRVAAAIARRKSRRTMSGEQGESK